MRILLSQEFGQCTHASIHVLPEFQVSFCPELWIEISQLIDCYAYALNMPEIGACGLGNLSGFENVASQPYFTAHDIMGLLRRDGLIRHAVLPNDASHVIAVFYGTNAYAGLPGIHCYRRDVDGWSHLYSTGDCGSGGVLQETDFSGVKIVDPRNCNRGPYNQFIGFWSIPYEGIMVRPKVSLGLTRCCVYN